MSGAFVKKDKPVMSSAGKQTKNYRGVRVVDEDESDYKFGKIQGSVEGTRVPRMSKKGGIVGSDNAHGTIIQGERLTCGPDGTGFTSMGTLDPVSGLQAVEEVPEPEVEEESENWDEEEVAKDLEELSQYEPVEMPTDPPSRGQGPITFELPIAPKYLKQPDKKKIKMQGSFGTYRGKYTNIQETDDLVVLLYDLSDPVYSPPPSAEPFTISCGKQSHKVYFAGIEFELDFLNQGVQVFVKME